MPPAARQHSLELLHALLSACLTTQTEAALVPAITQHTHPVQLCNEQRWSPLQAVMGDISANILPTLALMASHKLQTCLTLATAKQAQEAEQVCR